MFSSCISIVSSLKTLFQSVYNQPYFVFEPIYSLFILSELISVYTLDKVRFRLQGEPHLRLYYL